jgi:competence protein ComEA
VDEGDQEVRQRLRDIWPQARVLPDDSQWTRLDAAPPGRAALGSFDPGRRAIRALAVVAVLVVLGAGYLAWRAQPQPQPVPLAPSPMVSAVPATGSSIVVAIAGRVRRPGLVRLPAGARVQDALEAAGGVLPGTDLAFLNLARKLVDGELLVVGVTPPPGAQAAGAAGSGDGRVNLNTASLAELDGLPGIGPALAQRIIDYRAAHGGFRSVDELRRVEGIGDAKFAQLKDRVTV